MSGITVEAVLAAVDELLLQSAIRRGGTKGLTE
jgi:hypothetical protein